MNKQVEYRSSHRSIKQAHISSRGKRCCRRLTIPNHNEIAKGTLRAILQQAGLSIEEFLELL
ncbi:MAG: type II toxin-antitoxin system HicA family toxin [Candidatus Acidiferrales bacterium]